MPIKYNVILTSVHRSRNFKMYFLHFMHISPCIGLLLLLRNSTGSYPILPRRHLGSPKIQLELQPIRNGGIHPESQFIFWNPFFLSPQQNLRSVSTNNWVQIEVKNFTSYQNSLSSDEQIHCLIQIWDWVRCRRIGGFKNYCLCRYKFDCALSFKF